jgi:hypothetical protein
LTSGRFDIISPDYREMERWGFTELVAANRESDPRTIGSKDGQRTGGTG